ncbi:MAG: precorrin-6y C5,15-methyltransferase (decarboxylating) subunit CbiE [Clostridiales bacterium]
MENKKPFIIGIGPGNQEYLYPMAEKAIANADVLIGGNRNLAEFAHLNKETLSIDKSLKPIVDYIDANHQKKSIAVLASGDTGLFSIRAYLQKKLPNVPFTVLPGISSLQYLMAQKNLSWNEMKIITLHGNDNINLCNTVANNKVTAIFTGGKNTPSAIAKRLELLSYANLTLTVGENLSYPNERIISGTPQEIAAMEFDDLSLILAENSNVENKPWNYLTSGLPDELFIRDEVPMTKSEIRALILAKLRLKADSQILEIGAGTGSCTIEMALTAIDGKVWALEKNHTAVELCKKNIAKFALDNISLIEGIAPDDIPELPQIDHIFIGGSGGNMKDIIKKYSDKPLRLVVSAITLESVTEALSAMKECGFTDIEIIQAAVSRSKKAGTKHLMMGLNPITIVSGEIK